MAIEKEKESNVVELFKHIALCPDCEGSSFLLLVNPPGNDDESVRIIGFQCNTCGLKQSIEYK